MNASQQGLLERLRAFQFDEPGTVLTFSRRLARENGWSAEYAERVIGEYKKFLYLAVEAGHVVSPSEQVDQAWHLHLTYTRSYWDNLCGKVLGRPLHHGPTKGGSAEQARFVDLYNQTLESYRQCFDCEPPSDIWPDAEQRFGEDLQQVNVNTARYWIVPKPRLPRWPRVPSQGKSLFALGLVGLPVALAWNPLDLKGPEFLVVYVAVAIAAALLAGLTRILLAPQAEDLETQAPLDPYEVACLAAGCERTVHAAFAAMIQAGTLRLETEESKTLGVFKKSSTTTICQGKPLPDEAPRLERALSQAALPAKNFVPLGAAGLPIAREIEASLKSRGLLQSGPLPGRHMLASLIMLSPLLLGLAKISVGMERGRPVGFLVVACLATGAAAVAFLVVKGRQSATGKAMLKSVQATQSRPTKTTVTGLSPAQLATAVGLFGVGTLAFGPLANVHAMLPRACGGGADLSSSGGGCGTSGGGCGGGGCGGGGCGGGCGGCGS